MSQIRKTLSLLVLGLALIAGPASAAPQAQNHSLNINSASVEELAELPHVGPKRAVLIVQRRQQKPFKSVDELEEIKGIGEKTLEKLRPHVAVSAARK